MNKDNDTKSLLVFASLGMIPLIWIALLIAPSMEEGLFQALAKFGESLEKPFEIIIVKDSLRTVLLFLLIYWMGIGIYLSTRKNYRRGEEHGSAKWGDAHALNRKYADKSYFNNRILTQNVRIGLDGWKHKRNLSTLVVGGSGSGKTRFYCKPNVMQSTVSSKNSLVILDPKG